MKNIRVQEFLQKLLVVLIVIVMSFIDIAPLFGLAEGLDTKGVNEENVTSDEQGAEEDNDDNDEKEEERNLEGEFELESGDKELESGELDLEDELILDENELELDSELVSGSEEDTISDNTNVQQISINNNNIEAQSAHNYVLASDSDFSGTSNGRFTYIGTDEYVEIPHRIKGVNVTNYRQMFMGTSVKGVKSTNKNVTGMSFMFRDLQASSLDLSNFDTSSVTNMGYMFLNSQATSLNLSSVDTSKVTNMTDMFRNSKVTVGYTRTQADANKFNGSSNKPTSLTFYVVTIPPNYVLATDSDFSGTSNGSFRYIGTDEYVVIPPVIKGVNVTSYRNMFNGTSVKGVASTNKNVTNMSYMFSGSQATSLNISNLDTSNVTDMSRMFYNSKATSLDLRNFDTSSVTNMGYMFYGTQATSLDLRNFDTSSVTNMWSMFNSSQATRLDLRSFDTSKVTIMNSMFRDSQATSLDLSSFDTSKVTVMNYMFQNSQATSLDLSSFDTSSVTNMGYMFAGTKATSLDLRSFDTSKVTIMNSMFQNSQATIGYARTKNDASRFNRSSIKPTSLTFYVYEEDAPTGTITGNPTTWTNKDVTLTFKAKDDGSGVKRVRKPDNTWVNGSSTTYTVTSNGTYTFEAEDNIGNTAKFSVTVNRIDKTLPTVSISNNGGDYAQSHSTKITATDTGSGLNNVQYRWTTATTFPTSGFTNTTTGSTVNAPTTDGNHYLHIKATDKAGNVRNFTSNVFRLDNSVPTVSLSNNGGAYAQSHSTKITATDTGSGLNTLQYRWTTSTTFPTSGFTNTTTGTTVNAPTTEGNHYLHVKATDKVGNEQNFTSKVFRIDRTAPTHVSSNIAGHRYLSGSDYWVRPKDEVTVTFRQRDTGSGNSLGYIRLEGSGQDIRQKHNYAGTSTNMSPVNSSFVNTSHVAINSVNRTEHNATTGYGTLQWKVQANTSGHEYNIQRYYTDIAGNTVGYSNTYKLKVDGQAPTLTLAQSTTSATNQDVTITAKATDALSGFKRMQLPDKTWVTDSSLSYKVTSNGTYTFIAEDNVGNQVSKSITISNIDKTKPTVTTSQTPTGWTNQTVDITVNATDTGSGVQSIEYDEAQSTTTAGRNYIRNSQLDYKTQSYGWDTTLNGNLVPANSWSGGYNGGVTEPTKGYHAHIDTKKFGYPVMAYPNKNSTYGHKNRWLGFSQIFLETSPLGKQLKAGTKMTVSFDLYSDKAGGIIYGGGYRHQKSNGAKAFNKQLAVSATKANTWERKSFVIEVDNDWDLTKNFSLYLYGNREDNEATKYVKNVKIELGDKDTPYTVAPEEVKVTEETETKLSKVYTVSSNGTYAFKITDKAGNVTNVTHTVSNLDYDVPTGTITGNTSTWGNKDLTLTFKATDTGSGVKRVQKPDGTWVTGSTTTFVATENKTYTFKAEDNAGNIASFSESVTRIDKTTPVIKINTDGNSTPKKEQSTVVNVSDTGSGLATSQYQWTTSATFPTSGTWTNVTNGQTLTIKDKTGNYYLHVQATDKAGNVTKATSKAFNVDNTPPVKPTLTKSTTSWTNKDVTVTVNYPSDADKKQVKIGTGSWVDYTKPINVSSNTSVSARAIDLAGNISVESVLNITNIDKQKPTLKVTGNPTDWEEKDEVTLTITATDALSGVKNITLPDGKVVVGSNATFKVSENKDYTFKVTDNAGNVHMETITVDKMMIHYYIYVSDRNGHPIVGAEFELLRNGKVYKTAISDETGLVDFGKIPPVGDYTIRQITNSDGVEIPDPDEIIPDVTEPSTPDKPTEYPIGETLVKPVIKATPATWTNKDVTLNITYDKDSDNKQVKIGNGEWETYKDNLKVASNTKIYARSYDAKGNWSPEAELNITHIDKTKPTYTVKQSIDSWVKGYIRLTITAKDDRSGVSTITNKHNLTPDVIKENQGELIHEYIISKNNTYTFIVTDKAGNTETITHNVTNIDTEKPEIEVTGNPTDWYREYELNLQVKTLDKLSGIKQVTLPDKSILTGKAAEEFVYPVTKNGDYTFIVEDRVGNTTTHTETVTKLETPFAIKVVNSNNEGLEGATFELYRDDKLVSTKDSDKDGRVDFGLLPTSGEYEIRQTKVLDGYQINSQRLTLQIPEDVVITNYLQSETLPSTGTYEFIIYSVIVLTVIGLTVITYTYKREEQGD